LRWQALARRDRVPFAMRLIALIIVVTAIALESGAMRAEDIKVNKWPADVPCNAVKRNR
jgi:hypothetical protein